MQYEIVRHDVNKEWQFIIDEVAKVTLECILVDLNDIYFNKFYVGYK